METLRFEVRKIYELPVKKVVEDGRFCIVEANGKEYPIQLYPFQQNEELPPKMSCYVRDLDPNSGEPKLKQDTSVIIPKLYHIGNVYSFKVREISSHIISVADEYGFQFDVETDKKFTYGKKIDCLITDNLNGRLKLEIVNTEEDADKIPYYTVEQIIEKIQVPHRMAAVIIKSFKKSRWYQGIWNSYENKDEEWYINLMLQLSKDLYLWAVQVKKGGMRAVFRKQVLDFFQRACVFLLEDSDMLLYYSDREREGYQHILSESSQNALLMVQAFELIKNKEAVKTVDLILEKIARSAYLIDPNRQLRLLMLLLSCDSTLMNQKMTRVFDIIINGNHASWSHDPFRKAFVEMLERYISQNKNCLDRLTTIHTSKEREMYEKMVKALSIQQMLCNNKDNVDKQLNCAILLRYLTLLQVGDKNQLLGAALLSLAAVNSNRPYLQWNDCRNIDFIPTKMLSSMSSSGNTIQLSYEASTCSFDFDGKVLEIHPLFNRQQEVAVPSRLLPNNNIRVYLPQRLKGVVREYERDLLEYQKCWKEIETLLMDTGDKRTLQQKKYKHTPSEGDEVTIIIDDKLGDDGVLFKCKIVDEVYEGEGTICTRDIISYDAHTNKRSFEDDNGYPLKLKAHVKQVNSDGTYQFSLISQVRNFFSTIYKEGSSITCRINSFDQKRQGILLCVGELGVSVRVKYDSNYMDEDDFQVESYVVAEVENYDEKSGCIWAYYVREAQYCEEFVLNETFGDCIYNLADEGDVYIPKEKEEPEESAQQQINMDVSYIREIINIVDRMGVIEADHIATYNYLSFARILTLLVGDKDLANQYRYRLKLLQKLQHYADNKINGNTMLKELIELEHLASNNPSLQNRVYELKLIAYLDDKDKNEDILEIMRQENTDEHLCELCQLAYCYNSLCGFKLTQEREAIRKKFYEKLGFTYEYKERICYGDEDLHQEFKTSVVYPPENNMRADVDTQTQNILKVICGFMNAEGGVLYIGVNDDGLACGLEQDIVILGSYDRFNRHIHDSISTYLGKDIDNLIKEEWIDDDDYRVYKLTIPRLVGSPVLLDGAFYRRQSSSTRLINVR